MEGYLAEIRGFAGNFAPKGWAMCQGQVLSVATNTALFSLLGPTYGGDGRTTFALPDLRGRTPISSGQGPGLHNYNLGKRSGVESVTLNTLQMPTHTHFATMNQNKYPVAGSVAATMSVSTSEAEDSSPSGNYLGVSSADVYADSGSNGNTLNSDAIKINTSGLSVNVPSDAVTVGNTGGSQAFSIMQPYLTINWIICTKGLYPMRS